MQDDPYRPPATDVEPKASLALPSVPPGLGIVPTLKLALRLCVDAMESIWPLVSVIFLAFYVIGTALSIGLSYWLFSFGPLANASGVSDPPADLATMGLLLTLPTTAMRGLVALTRQALWGQAFLHALLEHHRTSAAVPLGRSLRYAMTRFWPSFRAVVASYLIVIVGTLFCLVPGLLARTRLAFVQPALALEPKQPPLRHSNALAQTRGWRVFGTLLCAMIVSFIVVLPLQLPMLVQRLTWMELPEWLMAGPLVLGIATFVASVVAAFVQAWTDAVVVVMYLSIRAEPEVEEAQGKPAPAWVELG